MEYDYSNLIMVKDGVPSREPVPIYLLGLNPIDLLDLSWLDPQFGLQTTGWWPADDQSPPLGRFQVYGPNETLTVDAARKVVVVVKEVITLPNLSRRLSRLALRNRFTADERAVIELAALDDPAAAPEARRASALLRSYMGDLAVAAYVDLDHPTTVAAFELMTTMNAITAERAAGIRAAEVAIPEEP